MMFFFAIVYVYLLVISSVVAEPASCYFHDQTLPTSMYAHQAIFSPSKNAVYLFGGYSGTTWDNAIDLDKVYKWDLSDSSAWFVEIGKTPTSAGHFASWIKNAVVVNDRVFFIGIDSDKTWSGKFFVYDLNTESFMTEAKISVPDPLWFGCLTTNSTHIFMVDGCDDSNTQRFPIIQVYDVAADTWQSQVLGAGPFTNGGWCLQYCSLVGDALFVMGGTTNKLQTTLIDGIYRINTRTLEIEQLDARLPAPNAYGVSIYDDQNLYLFGLAEEIIAIDMNTFAISTAFLSQQFFSSAPVLKIGGRIYRFGGEAGGDYQGTDKVEICDLPTQLPTRQPSNVPTSIPTALPSQLPTSAPSPIPTHSPTSNPTKNPSDIPTNVPSADPTYIPTSTPTLAPTTVDPTAFPSSDPTMSPLDVRPRPSKPNSDEYGVDTAIKVDGVLPQNKTDELLAALHEYAQNSANVTNCSERIDTSSEIEDEKTVLQLSIVTCSEEEEEQLLVAFDKTVLEYDIINVIVTEAEVEEIEIEGIYASNTETNDDATTPSQEYDLFRIVVMVVVTAVVAVAILSLFLCCAVAIRKCYVAYVQPERDLITQSNPGVECVERETNGVGNKDVVLSSPSDEEKDTLPVVTAGGYAQENIADDEFVVEDDDEHVTTTPGMAVTNYERGVGEK